MKHYPNAVPYRGNFPQPVREHKDVEAFSETDLDAVAPLTFTELRELQTKVCPSEATRRIFAERAKAAQRLKYGGL